LIRFLKMDDYKWIIKLADSIKNGKSCDRDDAEKVYLLDKDAFHLLLYAATEVRRHFKGNRVKTCSIVNARSGRCSEDCSFCAQSIHHNTGLTTYPLLEPDKILDSAKKEESYSRRFGIVTAGKKMSEADIRVIKKAVSGFNDNDLKQVPCASLGLISEKELLELKAAGLKRYHHNLEVSRNYYPNMCTTHTYDERLETINAARRAGLELCVGGIFGLGESVSDRLDLLYEIKACDPDAVPINFLVPIDGTPLADREIVAVWDAVKLIVLSRFIMPDKDIKLGAGRLEVFKDAQHLVFLAGANGMIIGDLLTVKGRTTEDDLKVITDLGLEITT